MISPLVNTYEKLLIAIQTLHRRCCSEIIPSADMTLIRSLASYYRHKLHSVGHHASRSNDLTASRLRGMPTFDQRRHHSGDQSGPPETKGEIKSNSDAQKPSTPPPPPGSSFSWRWAFGSILALLVPFWHNWKSLLRLEDEVEMVADAVENTAAVIEKVATVAEKVSSEVADHLPDDGKLKDAVLLVERISKETAEDAHMAKEFARKVDELTEEVDQILEPIKGPEEPAAKEDDHGSKHE